MIRDSRPAESDRLGQRRIRTFQRLEQFRPHVDFVVGSRRSPSNRIRAIGFSRYAIASVPTLDPPAKKTDRKY